MWVNLGASIVLWLGVYCNIFVYLPGVAAFCKVVFCLMTLANLDAAIVLLVAAP